MSDPHAIDRVKVRLSTKIWQLEAEIKRLTAQNAEMQNRLAAPHTLHVIGWIGSKRAYLDISPDEARQRYAASEPEHVEDYGVPEVLTISFEDEFLVYDAEPLSEGDG